MKRFWLVYVKFAMALLCVIGGHIEAVLGSDNNVTNIFQPLAQPAQEIKETSFLVLAVCAVIFVVVAGLLAYALIRFRHRAGDEASEPPLSRSRSYLPASSGARGCCVWNT